MEIWKTIPEYEGYYEVSDKGRVKSLERYIKVERNGTTFNSYIRERILKPCNKFGYSVVVLQKNKIKKNLSIHRLVWSSFKNKIGENMVIDHINNDSSDNNLVNLQEITTRENLSKDKWRKKKTNLPVGVQKRGNMYRAAIRDKNKMNNLGSFNTPKEAHNAYLIALKNINKNN